MTRKLKTVLPGVIAAAAGFALSYGLLRGLEPYSEHGPDRWGVAFQRAGIGVKTLGMEWPDRKYGIITERKVFKERDWRGARVWLYEWKGLSIQVLDVSQAPARDMPAWTEAKKKKKGTARHRRGRMSYPYRYRQKGDYRCLVYPSRRGHSTTKLTKKESLRIFDVFIAEVEKR